MKGSTGQLLQFKRKAEPGPSTEPLVDAQMLARHFSVTPRTIRRWREAGMPSVKRERGARRYRITECEAWMDSAG